MAGGERRDERGCSENEVVGNVDLVDQISELADCLKEFTLEKLPIQEAVRTCVPSKKWKCFWTGIEKLDFGGEFEIFARRFTALWYGQVVDRALRLHDGSICKFILRRPLVEDLDGEYEFDVNFWPNILSNHGIQEINIDGKLSAGFQIPACFSDCQELQHLSVQNSESYSAS